jgi:hypothetical protein
MNTDFYSWNTSFGLVNSRLRYSCLQVVFCVKLCTFFKCFLQLGWRLTGIRSTQTECSLNGPWMVPQCSLYAPWMLPHCSLNRPWMFHEWALNVPWMFTECSLNVPWIHVAWSWIHLTWPRIHLIWFWISPLGRNIPSPSTIHSPLPRKIRIVG